MPDPSKVFDTLLGPWTNVLLAILVTATVWLLVRKLKGMSKSGFVSYAMPRFMPRKTYAAIGKGLNESFAGKISGAPSTPWAINGQRIPIYDLESDSVPDQSN